MFNPIKIEIIIINSHYIYYMLEITRLNEITFDDFKKTIDYVIKEKFFIKNGIQKNVNYGHKSHLILA